MENKNAPKCCEKIYDRNAPWGGRYKPCDRPGKFERGGEYYCGIHDPVKRETKREERHNAWREEWRQRDARTAFVKACEQAIRDIASGSVDPLVCARSVLASEFGGSDDK